MTFCPLSDSEVDQIVEIIVANAREWDSSFPGASGNWNFPNAEKILYGEVAKRVFADVADEYFFSSVVPLIPLLGRNRRHRAIRSEHPTNWEIKVVRATAEELQEIKEIVMEAETSSAPYPYPGFVILAMVHLKRSKIWIPGRCDEVFLKSVCENLKLLKTDLGKKLFERIMLLLSLDFLDWRDIKLNSEELFVNRGNMEIMVDTVRLIVEDIEENSGRTDNLLLEIESTNTIFKFLKLSPAVNNYLPDLYLIITNYNSKPGGISAILKILMDFRARVDGLENLDFNALQAIYGFTK